jgi:type VI protein secretion system component VasF
MEFGKVHREAARQRREQESAKKFNDSIPLRLGQMAFFLRDSAGLLGVSRALSSAESVTNETGMYGILVSEIQSDFDNLVDSKGYTPEEIEQAAEIAADVRYNPQTYLDRQLAIQEHRAQT